MEADEFKSSSLDLSAGFYDSLRLLAAPASDIRGIPDPGPTKSAIEWVTDAVSGGMAALIRGQLTSHGGATLTLQAGDGSPPSPVLTMGAGVPDVVGRPDEINVAFQDTIGAGPSAAVFRSNGSSDFAILAAIKTFNLNGPWTASTNYTAPFDGNYVFGMTATGFRNVAAQSGADLYVDGVLNMTNNFVFNQVGTHETIPLRWTSPIGLTKGLHTLAIHNGAPGGNVLSSDVNDTGSIIVLPST